VIFKLLLFQIVVRSKASSPQIQHARVVGVKQVNDVGPVHGSPRTAKLDANVQVAVFGQNVSAVLVGHQSLLPFVAQIQVHAGKIGVCKRIFKVGTFQLALVNVQSKRGVGNVIQKVFELNLLVFDVAEMGLLQVERFSVIVYRQILNVVGHKH
jgi:hypothetical protein